MEKIARIISLEFDSAENRKETVAKFRSALNEIAEGIELSVVVNTSETSVMAIQIWPDEPTLQAYEERRIEWSSKNHMSVRDRISYEGDVDFWFQQIKYFGGDAIRVSGVGA